MAVLECDCRGRKIASFGSSSVIVQQSQVFQDDRGILCVDSASEEAIRAVVGPSVGDRKTVESSGLLDIAIDEDVS